MTKAGFLKTDSAPQTPRHLRALSVALVPILSIMVLGTAGSTAMAQQASAVFAGGLTTPAGGLVLSGTAINPATGKPLRYLWTADAANGLCRLDPDVDTAVAHSITPSTCLSTVNGAPFNAAQVTLDPATNTIYAVDGGGKAGIFVLHFLPGGDFGKGLMDQNNQSILAPTCGIAGNQPSATSLGPDGNLYVGFRRNGNIMRINAPSTNPPCANVQPTVIVTGDKLTSQMAWVGTTLFLTNSRFPVRADQADTCLTPQNGNNVCGALQGIALFGNPLPTALVSDQTSSRNGDDIYFGGLGAVNAITGMTQNPFGTPSGGTSSQITAGPGGFFANIGALAVDSSDPASNVLYVADDPSAGAAPPDGRWWQVLSAPPAPAPPSAPQNVSATAGNASATVTWTPPANHQSVTSYTVRNSLASNGVLVADEGVAGVTAATVTGLTNGVTYQFEVLATNAQGSSPLSAPSNSVTPQPPTVPGQPTNVSATNVGSTFVTVLFTAPANDGGSPITGYTVSAFTGGVLFSTTPAFANPAFVSLLTTGVAYTFSVHATNAIGDGPESTPSAPVTPGSGPNVTVTVTGPAVTPVIAGANAVYTLVATNVGASTASAVTLSDSGTNATVSTATTSQGACTIAANNVNCNLGNIAAGSSVTVTVTLKPSAPTTNTATVVFSGGSNTASATTDVIPLSQTTDIQTIGSAQNGGPAQNASDTFTWQIKNNQSLPAQFVHFSSTLDPNMVFQNVTPSGPCANPVGQNFSCELGTLNGGQTAIVTVTVTFKATGNLVTTGTASFAGTDNNPANDSAKITVGVK